MPSSSTGVTGGLVTTLPIAMTISAFTAIAWYNAIWLNVMIWPTFKRRKGLYFYTMLIATWGVVLHALGFIMKFFQIWTIDYISIAVIVVGWYCMVTGQSLVLYSRLYLVVRDARKIKWILYMIVIDAIVFHTLGTIFFFASNSKNHAQAAKFAPYFLIVEKIIMTGFCIQEFIIAGLYLYETQRILKPREVFLKQRTRATMWHLIFVNIFVVLLDIAMLCTEFTNQFQIQVSFKAAVYSVKLQLEFAILNRLVKLVQEKVGSGGGAGTPYWNEPSREGAIPLSGSTVKLNARNPSSESGENKSYGVWSSVQESKPAANVRHGQVLKTTDINVEAVPGNSV